MAKILIVDDDEVLRFILGEYLGTWGHEYTLAADARQARIWLKLVRFDLIFSDLHMPGESGLEFLRFVASHHPGVPFVLMSADDGGRVRREARQLGVFKFMSKPFHCADLQRTIAEMSCREHEAAQGGPRWNALPCTV